MTATFDCRVAFAETLADLARRDPRVVAVVNDSVGSSKLGDFAGEFGARLVNVGIAEQNQIGVAAGLANGGFTPFVSAAGSFLSARALEQIKVDVAYSRRHVVLCAQSPGVAYGPLGSTHHSVEDVAWLRVLPNMTVVVPADPAQTAAVLRWAHGHDGPVYVRIAREPVPAIFDADHVFRPGRVDAVREGSDVTIVANGIVLHRALAAAEALAAEGVEARVLAAASVKPLDDAAILTAARETGGIVTVEEGYAAGGLGGAVSELVAREASAPVRVLGFGDAFAATGSVDWLLAQAGLTPAGIAAAARDLLRVAA